MSVLDFPFVIAGEIGYGTLVVTNTDNVSADITSIDVTGPGFSLDSTTCGATLAADASCDLVVAVVGGPGFPSGELAIDSQGDVQVPLTASIAAHLFVTVDGTGNVYSYPNGIDCGFGAYCDTYFFETEVALDATVDLPLVFTGWSDPECGSSPTCVVEFGAGPTEITATFVE
jgi:hypothetical protein